tara:strand:- start:301649 stop:304264 length:2616 start_codon:yes stop_codon:yes gene_type:complete
VTAHRDTDGQITAALGPTNTGKTHLAVERMLGRSSGMIGLPLRLLAREVYDRVVRAKGAAAVALVTGEEKIVPKSARYFICTAEAMPLNLDVAFVAIDEVQLAADPERGHVFTDRMLYCRGSQETMLLGAATMGPLIRELIPSAHIATRERFSQLSHTGPAKLTRLPRRSAIVAFSAESVYAIAELMRRRRGGAAVVMGGLSPRTRNAQVELYQSGEVDFLVATDAIGMGLNMDVDHVAFAESRKFDGRKRRRLSAAELAQIAGRAGRFRNDGTFGETADCGPFDPDLVRRIENHQFAPVTKLQWRNPDLDERSLDALLDSLAEAPDHPALERAREAIDERTLALLAADPQIRDRTASMAGVRRLWDACRLPDFRKATIDAHANLVRTVFLHLTGPTGHLPDDWLNGHLQRLDRTDGEVDVLAARLTQVRTWAYAAHRPDWTADPEHWQERTREIEDALSDALHEKLMQRFVDRRTGALMKGLRDERELLAGVSPEGEITVEGHYVGRLAGLTFKPDAQGRELAARALRSAAIEALRPEVNRRLGALARVAIADITLGEDGSITWLGEPIARLTAGPTALRPAVTLIGAEIGAPEARARARSHLESLVSQLAQTRLAPLLKLRDGANGDSLAGLASGIAWRLFEAGGALPRTEAGEEIQALSPAERRTLRALGVQIGEHMIYVPALIKPAAARLNALLRAIHAGDTRPAWRPAPGLTSLPRDTGRSASDHIAIGYQPCGPRAVRFDILERLADIIRDARTAQGKGQFTLSPAMTALLGCNLEDLRSILGALDYRRLQKGKAPDPAAEEVWVRRRRKPSRPMPVAVPAVADAGHPFSALAELKFAPTPAKRPVAQTTNRRKRRRPPRQKAGT